MLCKPVVEVELRAVESVWEVIPGAVGVGREVNRVRIQGCFKEAAHHPPNRLYGHNHIRLSLTQRETLSRGFMVREIQAYATAPSTPSLWLLVIQSRGTQGSD